MIPSGAKWEEVLGFGISNFYSYEQEANESGHKWFLLYQGPSTGERNCDQLYDREGNIIDAASWHKMFQSKAYKNIAQDYVSKYFIATVWTGKDNCIWPLTGKPWIFETVVVDVSDESEGNYGRIEREVYCTQEEALEGHNATVLKYIKRLEEEVTSSLLSSSATLLVSSSPLALQEQQNG